MGVKSFGNSAAIFRSRFGRTGNRASANLLFPLLSVPTSISAPGTWNLQSNPLVITTAGIHTIASISGNIPVTAKLWGSGANSAPAPAAASQPGGGGGFSQGSFTITPSFNCVIVVGNTGSFGGSASPPDLSTYSSGGYTGIFYSSISQANSIIIAGGGGSPGWNDVGTMSGGGGGGGTTGQDAPPLAAPYTNAPGKGGTQSAGGAGGVGGFSNGTAGSALQGGAGGVRNTNGAGGGSGGGGYYGGGGGGGQSAVNTGGGGGGGGSGYIGGHPLVLVTGGTTTQATSRTSAGAPDPSYPLVGIAGSGSLFPGGATGTGAIQISFG